MGKWRADVSAAIRARLAAYMPLCRCCLLLKSALWRGHSTREQKDASERRLSLPSQRLKFSTNKNRFSLFYGPRNVARLVAVSYSDHLSALRLIADPSTTHQPKDAAPPSKPTRLLERAAHHFCPLFCLPNVVASRCDLHICQPCSSPLVSISDGSRWPTLVCTPALSLGSSPHPLVLLLSAPFGSASLQRIALKATGLLLSVMVKKPLLGLKYEKSTSLPRSSLCLSTMCLR